jgi:hypothetical protein
VNTTVFITRLFKSTSKGSSLQMWLTKIFVCWTCLALLVFSPVVRAAELTQLSIERADDGVYLSALVRFDLPAAVEDALGKGIPMFFVAEADVYQSRWYWTDRRVASATRTIRLAYQPLTRRWRVNIVTGLINSSAGLRATLNQNYDSLNEAMSAVQRLSRWRIADNAEIEGDIVHRLEFNFNLDLSQLPRPFQIGVVGQRDWAVTVQRNERLLLGVYRPADKTKALAQPVMPPPVMSPPAMPPPAKEADK